MVAPNLLNRQFDGAAPNTLDHPGDHIDRNEWARHVVHEHDGRLAQALVFGHRDQTGADGLLAIAGARHHDHRRRRVRRFGCELVAAS